MPIVDIKLVGFAPDLDPRTPGIFTQCERIVPSLAGFSPMPAPESVGLDALAAACRGGAVLVSLDNSKRLVTGTQTKLYTPSGTSWSDISKAGSYTGSTESLWRFAQFGNNTIAVNGVDPMQRSTGAAFDDVGGDAPIAAIVETCGPGFVMAFNYDDGVNVYQDGWYCCALADETDWTPSIGTESANGRLTQTPGPIRAAKRLGQQIVVYKERSMYIGTYVGPPTIWDWQLVPGDIGAASQEAVINIGTAHIFPGFDDLYYFDGSRPVSIGSPLKKWYNDNVSGTYRYKMKGLHDRANSNVYFFFPDSDGNIADALVYNYRADKWGETTLYTGKTLEHALEYIPGSLTYDALGDSYSTWQDLPSVTYNSPFWTSGSESPAIIQNDHKLYSLTAIPTQQSSFTVGYTGSDRNFSTLSRLRPSFITAASGTAYVNTVDYIGNTATVNGPYTLASGKIDCMLSSKWFAPKLVFADNYEITGISGEFEEDGIG